MSVAVEGSEKRVSPAEAKTRLRFRADIEGLRGLAILGPVMGHFIGDASAGALSAWTYRLVPTVDIFFVISGFLLTTLLIMEYEQSRKRRLKPSRSSSRKGHASAAAPDPGDPETTGRSRSGRSHKRDRDRSSRLSSRRIGTIPVLDFYERRGRRLLPAALFVNACTLVLAWFLFNETRFAETQAHSLWTALQVENLYLITQATDYFSHGGADSPFIHYWTLSITEQFSLLWPLVLLGATRTLRFSEWLRRGDRWWIPVIVATGLIAVPSMIISVIESIESPNGAYLSTVNRLWIILIGASAAIIPPLRKGFGPKGAARASWAGALMVIASLVIVDEGTPYPGIAAIVPAVGTALLMLAGVRERAHTPVTSLLETGPVRFTGRIAYPLYLWHWPVIVFCALLIPREDLDGFGRMAVLVTITVLISWATHVFIEMPFHNVKKLRSQVRDKKGRWVATPRQATQVFGLGFVAIASLSVLGLWARPTVVTKPSNLTKTQMAWATWDPSAGQPGHSGSERTAPRPAAPREVSVEAWRKAVDRAAARQVVSRADIAAAAMHASRPETSCFDILTAAEAAACSGQGGGPAGGAWPKGAQPAAAVIGNSMASQWTGTIGSLLPNTVTLTPLTLSSCDPAGSPDDHERTKVQGFDCGKHVTLVDSQVAKTKPGLAVLGFTPMIEPGEGSQAMLARWSALVDRIRARGARVLLIGPPPLLPTLADCLPRDGTDVSACDQVRDPEIFQVDALAKSAFAAKGVTYLSLVNELCRGQVCPEFVNGIPSRLDDGGHLSASAVWGMRSRLRESLAQALRTPAN